MQPTDPFNMVVFLIALWCIREGWDAGLLLVMFVGLLNRETPLVLPLVYSAVHIGLKPMRQWLGVAVASMAIGVTTYLGLRIVLGFDHPPYAGTNPIGYWLQNLRDLATYLQMAGFFNIVPFLAAYRFSAKPAFLRRTALVLTPLFFVIHVSVGYLKEARLFLPVLMLLIPLAMLSLKGQPSRDS